MNSTPQFPRIPPYSFVSRIIHIPQYFHCELFVFLTVPTTNCLSYLYFFKVDLMCPVCIPYYSYGVLFVLHNITQMYYWYSLLIEHLFVFLPIGYCLVCEWLLFGIRSVLMDNF